MPEGIGYNPIASAMMSGNLGLQRAGDNITQASSNIAQRTANGQPEAALAATTAASRGEISTPVPPTSLSEDVVNLSSSLTYAKAAARVVDVAGDNLGRLLDIKA